MSSEFTIRDSLEVQFTKAPTIAIAGESGSGKTESAMRLARGWCGATDKFVVIDTEEKRSLYKKDRHQPWDWIDFQPPFTPERTWAVLDSVKHYKAVILDSTSHEYAGDGGISEEAENNLERMSKGDPDKAERLLSLAWKTPKMRHKRELMSHLIRYPTMLICCLRAEPKIKFVKVQKDGRTVNAIVDAGSQPICEKRFMFEMLASFMMYAERAGIPEQVKALEEDLRPVFIEGQRIDEATGARLRAWADSRTFVRPAPLSDHEPIVAALITEEQADYLRRLCRTGGVSLDKFLEVGELGDVRDLPAADYAKAVKWIEKRFDEAVTLRLIDKATDEGEGAAILELCKTLPFHKRAVEAFNNRFQQR